MRFAGRQPGMLDEVILRVFDWFEGPIAIGLRSGHVSRRNVTLPFGIEAELDLEGEPVLRFLERASEKEMRVAKHIHLIGICGSAMASLAGLLQMRGYRVTGSDAAAYPPMSDLLLRSVFPSWSHFRSEPLAST